MNNQTTLEIECAAAMLEMKQRLTTLLLECEGTDELLELVSHACEHVMQAHQIEDAATANYSGYKNPSYVKRVMFTAESLIQSIKAPV